MNHSLASVVDTLRVVLSLLMFTTGNQSMAVAALLLPLGILAGIVANANQYLISESAAEAPVFADGLYLTAQNPGITVGAALCGLFISLWGIRFTRQAPFRCFF